MRFYDFTGEIKKHVNTGKSSGLIAMFGLQVLRRYSGKQLSV
jgi:hypothetical protein